MPSPIAHAVSGYAIVKGLEPANVERLWRMALYAVFVAIAADFDFIPQIITGINTHRGFTHSLGFAIIFSLVISALAIRSKTFQSFHYMRLWSLTLLIYSSHLILDFFTQGTTGVPLFWPISGNMFQSAVPIFPSVQHSLGVFAPIHLIFLSVELTYSVILLWGLSRWTRHQQLQKNSIATIATLETLTSLENRPIRK